MDYSQSKARLKKCGQKKENDIVCVWDDSTDQKVKGWNQEKKN